MSKQQPDPIQRPDASKVRGRPLSKLLGVDPLLFPKTRGSIENARLNIEVLGEVIRGLSKIDLREKFRLRALR